MQQQFEEQRQAFRTKEQHWVKMVSDKEELFHRESRVKNEVMENCMQLKQQIAQLKQQLCDKVNTGKFYCILFPW